MVETKKPYNIMPIKGKIVSVESFGTGDKKVYSHQLMLPGKDEYSQVKGILVNAPTMLGTEDQVVELLVEFSGFVKRFKYVDKETGEQKEGRSLDSRFNLVKARPAV